MRTLTYTLILKILDKKGNSNTAERMALIQDFLDCFGGDCIDCLVAGREFVGQQWMESSTITPYTKTYAYAATSRYTVPEGNRR